MRVILCVAVWLLGLFSGTAYAARVFDILPQTGQTKCYDSVGGLIDCAGTGQDGEFKRGIPWPEPRFVDHGDGTITDTLTGLMWLKDANCAHTIGYNPNGADPFIGNMSWGNALDFVKKINTGTIDACGSYATGYTDWHLPTPRELKSLVNYGASNAVSWLTNRGFLNVAAKQTGCFFFYCSYWTATTQTGFPADAVVVDLESETYWWQKSFDPRIPYLTWPVRRDNSISHPSSPVFATGQIECYDEAGTKISCPGTGQDGETQQGITWPSERFIDHGDGTVTDVFTNLMWLKSFPTGNITWQDALDYAKGMNSGVNSNYGYTDWYIPNIHEGLSLISWGALNPALPSGHPFNLAPGYAGWTSTTAFYSRSGGMWAEYYMGRDSWSYKDSNMNTPHLPVRSLMFRNAVGNFYQSSGKYDTGQCVPYVRYETWLPWKACNGPAYQCFSQAQTAGYYTGSVPRVGSIIVFAADVSKNIPDGHVAIVTAINGNKVTMQDQNWVKPRKIGVHTENVTNYNILGYIYP